MGSFNDLMYFSQPGTAVLHHGSYIKLGCVQFVFSIVEQATRHPIIIQRPDGSTPLLTPVLGVVEMKQEPDVKQES